VHPTRSVSLLLACAGRIADLFLCSLCSCLIGFLLPFFGPRNAFKRASLLKSLSIFPRILSLPLWGLVVPLLRSYDFSYIAPLFLFLFSKFESPAPCLLTSHPQCPPKPRSWLFPPLFFPLFPFARRPFSPPFLCVPEPVILRVHVPLPTFFDFPLLFKRVLASLGLPPFRSRPSIFFPRFGYPPSPSDSPTVFLSNFAFWVPFFLLAIQCRPIFPRSFPEGS